MKIALSDTRQSRASRFLVAVAIVASAVLCLGPTVTAGQPDNSPRPPFGSSTPPRETVAPVSTTAGISKIRVGKHPDFTRVVLELTGSYEWTIEQPPGGPVRILIPGAGVDASIRRIEFSSGVIRSVQTARRANGVEVILVCQPAGVKVRTLTLTEPERLVLDVSLPGAGEEGRTLAQAAVQPAVNPAKASAPAPAPRAGSEKSPASETPTPEPADRTARAPAASGDAGKEAAGGSGTGATVLRERDGTRKLLTIVLDPGHGGHDTGAIGPTGLMEKDVVLDLASRLRRLLQDRLGVRVLMTRTEDEFVSLADRSAFANRAKADFLISLHVNAASKRGAVGFETFFFAREPSDNDARASAQRENLVVEGNGAGGNDLEALLKTTLADMAVTRDIKESSNLAERLLASLEKILRVDNRGVKSGPFYILATAAMPAVLVESAFITNPKEERKLQRDEHRQRIADALYEGIAAYKVRYEQRLGLRTAPAGVGS
jgi:N-acetylmuramoyl-L-alanine amidase